MDIRLLDNAAQIRKAFVSRFLLTWEEFQVQHKEWIAKNTDFGFPISIEWYDRSYMWDRVNSDFIGVSMDEALSYLRRHSGPVLFMSELGEDTHYRGERIVDFVAEADAHTLADKIRKEWFDAFVLTPQNMYDPDAFLPDDLYVFDTSMKWCVVFTHENEFWECEIDEPMKAAESRYCIICREK